MNQNITAIQYMGMIMRNQSLNIDYVLNLVEIVNNSYLSAKDVITILQQIFKNQKSAKILLGTQVLQYLVKNGNRNFHQAANKQSFQKSVLGLLKRQRGKMNILKQLRSNTENWARIESRILYLIQLWYDAFILEESKYPNIINNYKILRKQNIVFPPRNVNQRSLLAIKTESPIFDNIETIAQADKEKFKKKLKAMGLTKLSQKFEQKDLQLRNMPKNQIRPPIQSNKQIDIDDISQKIAIIQSQDYNAEDVIKIIDEVKIAIQTGKVKQNEEIYWKEVKEAAQVLIQQWEQKNSKFIQQRQQRFLEEKMNGKLRKVQSSPQSPKKVLQQNLQKKEKKPTNEVFDLLGDQEPQRNTNQNNFINLGFNFQKKQNTNQNSDQDEWGQFNNQPAKQEPKRVTQQFNLLDL